MGELWYWRSWWRWVALGAVLTTLIHIQFTLFWDWYLNSVPGYPEAFSKGSPPEAELLASPASRYVGILAYFLIGLSVRMSISDKSSLLIASITAGSIVAHIIISGFFTDSLRGNLWPFGIAWWIVFIPLAVSGGVAAGIGLRAVRHRFTRLWP